MATATFRYRRFAKSAICAVTGALFLFAGFVLPAKPTHAQDRPTEPPRSSAELDRLPRVYLDCEDCYESYLRRHLTFVNYVRDRKQADIHLLGTRQGSGGGGSVYRLQFIGRGAFQGWRYELTYDAPPTLTDDDRRRGLAERIRVGLVPFAGRSPAADRLSVAYDADTTGADRAPVDDPWNHWVFEIGGSGDIGLEEAEEEYEVEGNIDAERVTEAWKLEFGFDSEYELDIFENNEKEIRSVSRDTDFDADVVKSLGDHWGAGLSGDAFSRTFTNTDLALGLSGAVEYNFFPYAVSDQRELTVRYRIGPEYRNYTELTIFNRREQVTTQQSLRIELDLDRPWGSVFASLEGAHYFHDLTLNSAEFYTGIDVKLVEGLSIDGSFSVELIQDQLYLPAGDATLDEILLRRRALATNFEVDASIGLSYTFGSIYNNVVNTRL